MKKRGHNDKKRILELVRQYYFREFSEKEFIPGKSKVHYAGRVFDEREMQALVDSSLDFWLTLGTCGRKFEESFSRYLDVKHTVVVNSGSSANLAAVSALCSNRMPRCLKVGDEVLTTALNFPTTIAPLVQNGLVPVFVDVDPGTYNIDVSRMEQALTDRTRAIFLAHTLGNPFNVKEVLRLKEKYGLFLIEDACDALDSRYNGRAVGTFGEAATFSFYAAHHITMGEGGAVTTNDPDIHKNLLSIRDWGRDCWCGTGESDPAGACQKRFNWSFPGLPQGYDHKYTYTNIGYNLKPLDLQCAIGLEQLKKLKRFTRKRNQNFKTLYSLFQEYGEYFLLPRTEKEAEPSWFAFPVTVRPNKRFSKNEFVRFLEDHLIETRPVFAGNILKHPAYQNIRHRVAQDLVNTDQVLFHSFFMGVYPGLGNEQMDYIGRIVRKFFKG
ncbi:MAG: lipopolysaccharide biosynthesis protein RfbH [bacterium]|nr:lipopolysaccharide biosynthesis protein RfbH [bacterium]